MLVVKKLGEDLSTNKYKVSIDDKTDNKKPKSVIMDTDEYPKKHHHNHHNNHLDHYIESQHHGANYPHDKTHNHGCANGPSVSFSKPHYCEHPRRHIEPLEVFDRKFPKQEVMLLDIETSIKQTITIKFKYNTETITKYISEDDIVHAYFIDKGNNEAQLTEITGKISYIDFVNKKIFIDYSELYSACKKDIYISALRFISTDIYEVAPFFKEDEPVIEPPDEEIIPPMEEDPDDNDDLPLI